MDAHVEAGGSPIAELRFLVVEDHGFQRWLLTNALAGMGAQLTYGAADGKEALEILADREPPVDIIITDLDMPGMDGLEFIRHLGALHYPASLIVASAMQPALITTVVSMAREYGVPLLGTIAKPVTEAKLREALKNWMGSAPLAAAPEPEFAPQEIESAMARGEFVPYFQPQVDLLTNRITGAEALVRWRHPQWRVVRPASFMAMVESSEFLDDLTASMFTQVIEACAGWRKAGLKAGVSINVSIKSLRDVKFADRLVAQVREAGLEPQDLVIEITETAAVASLGETLENLGRLRMRGFGLSIDDFGIGYSSMDRLARLPFTELKIDRSFVANASTQPSSRAMLESSLDAALKLGLTSVAEGVESRAEWELVRSLKCDLAQGYYIARPMQGSEVLEWAMARERGAAQASPG